MLSNISKTRRLNLVSGCSHQRCISCFGISMRPHSALSHKFPASSEMSVLTVLQGRPFCTKDLLFSVLPSNNAKCC